MTSPFPGMDPFIESCGLWGDFHGRLISKILARLEDQAPDRYVVRCGERSYVVLVEEEGKKHHPFLPDVSVTTERRKKPGRGKGGTAVAAVEPAAEGEPVTMRAFVAEEHREAFVEIHEAAGDQRLVTAIEVLSPSNKRPGTPGWDLYQRKRQSLLLGEANLVEVDLLRGGQRLPMLDPWPRSPYTLLVARTMSYALCRVWPAHIQRRLPAIPVPLATPDPDLSLDLQPMIEEIYRRSRYARSIDYTRPAVPPLSRAETTWLKQQLRTR